MEPDSANSALLQTFSREEDEERVPLIISERT